MNYIVQNTCFDTSHSRYHTPTETHRLPYTYTKSSPKYKLVYSFSMVSDYFGNIWYRGI